MKVLHHLVSLATAAAALLAAFPASAQRVDLIVSTILHDDSSRTLSTRDIPKRAMKQETYSPQGVLTMKRLFQLDRQGKVQSGLAFDGQENPILTFRYEYDELDRLSQEQVLDMEGNLLRVLFTTYDELGRPTKKAVSYPKMEKATDVHQYALDHPETLEHRGKKLPGNRLDQGRKTKGKSVKNGTRKR